MELKVLTEQKDTIELEVNGDTHTFSNLLRKELWENNEVATASYQLKHPLSTSPVFTIKAKSGKPRKHLQEALTSLKKKTKELKDLIKKLK